MTLVKGTGAFPKIYHDIDPEFQSLFDGPVEITEKIDGSQFGFGLVDGELLVRSKSNAIDLKSPNGLFKNAVKTVVEAHRTGMLKPGYFYYGETLQNKRHNRLSYGRVPVGNVALFAIRGPDGLFLPYEDIRREAYVLGMEPVPLLFAGELTPESRERLQELLEAESYYGGCQREGIVIKGYNRKIPYKTWEVDCPVLAGKIVGANFKEVMRKSGEKSERKKDGLEGKIREFFGQWRTEARWEKAIQHTREDGRLEGRMSDIGLLVKEIQSDVLREEESRIKEGLWNLLKKEFLRECVAGFPQMYEERLRADLARREDATC